MKSIALRNRDERVIENVLVDVAEFMEHPMAKDFYVKYMKHPSTRNQMMYLLFLYSALPDSALPYEKVAVLQELIQRQSNLNTSPKQQKNNAITI